MSNKSLHLPVKILQRCLHLYSPRYVSGNTREVWNLSQAIYYEFISTDAVAFSNAHFGAGIGPIHLHAVGCNGREASLTDCPEVRSTIYCLQGHSVDAGVRCQGLISSVANNYNLS